MPLTSLVLRLVKGSALTAQNGDDNWTRIRDFVNALEQLMGVVLKSDGTLRDGAVGTTAVLADGVVTNAKLAADAKFPPGAMVDFAGSAAPAGWLIADGSQVSRTGQAALFAAIGTSWGIGDGSLTFNLPDTRGRCTIGAGQGSGLTNRAVGQIAGEETHVLVKGELPSQSYSFQIKSGELAKYHADGNTGDTSGGLLGLGSDYGGPSSGGVQPIIETTTTVGATDQPHQNMQPYAVATKIIKT